VETDRAQLVWRRAGPGPARITLTDPPGRSRSWTIDTDGGPGAFVIEDLAPGVEYDLVLAGGGLATMDRHHRFTTAVDPPGQLLTRLVTANDSHLGEDRFGYLRTIRERPRPEMPSSERCLRSAVSAMAAWEPDHAVFKGDIVNHGTRAEWDTAHRIASSLPVRTDFMLGNHEANARHGIDPVAGAAAGGVDLRDPVRVRDLPGVRVILADTPVRRTNRGDIVHVADPILDAASDAGSPVLLFLHHNLQPHRLPTFLPPGVAGHKARAFLDRLESVAPASIAISGHTHRNRRRDHGGIPVVEVGSTKDYPGVWAGYSIHEGGIRQVTYRVAEPSCLRWTERTRWAALGLWGRWSPGSLEDRCFTHRWPD
jgi:3',5'-cyclic-AMP phosphodiesterase